MHVKKYGKTREELLEHGWDNPFLHAQASIGKALNGGPICSSMDVLENVAVESLSRSLMSEDEDEIPHETLERRFSKRCQRLVDALEESASQHLYATPVNVIRRVEHCLRDHDVPPHYIAAVIGIKCADNLEWIFNEYLSELIDAARYAAHITDPDAE